jgi:hypothetical protein
VRDAGVGQTLGALEQSCLNQVKAVPTLFPDSSLSWTTQRMHQNYAARFG